MQMFSDAIKRRVHTFSLRLVCFQLVIYCRDFPIGSLPVCFQFASSLLPVCFQFAFSLLLRSRCRCKRRRSEARQVGRGVKWTNASTGRKRQLDRGVNWASASTGRMHQLGKHVKWAARACTINRREN